MRRIPVRLAAFGGTGAVAAIAAIQSYNHIYDLARAHHENRLDAQLLPLSVDGLIVVASSVMLHEAIEGRRPPGLARAMLTLGIAATIIANVSDKIRFGVFAGAISAWSAVAFVGTAELVIVLLRRRAQRAAEASPGPVSSLVPATNEDAARAAYQASVRGANPLSMNQLTTRFGITRTTARQILASSNGHGQ